MAVSGVALRRISAQSADLADARGYADRLQGTGTRPCGQSAATGSVDPVIGTGYSTAGRRSLRPLRALAAVVLVVHGFVHLMGVALLWRWGEPGELRYGDVRPEAGSTAAMVVGGVWVVALLLFLVTAALVAGGRPAWRPVGLLAALVSIGVLLPSAPIAWAGLVVDAALLVGVAVTVAAANRSRGAVPAGRNR